VGAAPALAKGTIGVELAGRAEQATTAELKALEPRGYGKGAHRCEMPQCKLGMK